jgi:hypothetical protein
MTNRRWLLASRPEGIVGPEHFEWREEPVPSIGDGEVLIRNLWLSCDPAQRAWMQFNTYVPAIPLGEVMAGGAAGEVVQSRHPDYSEGQLVAGVLGWQDYCVSDGGSGIFPLTPIPPGVDPPTALSLFGVTGLTAHIGLLEFGRPEAGETVVVSGAAGAVGSLVCQIAKIKDCRVIGIAGGERKCRWLEDELGADHAIDYKSEDVFARLGELTGRSDDDPIARIGNLDPGGIDVYFDNVGGEILDSALATLAMNARVVLCGSVSDYSDMEHRAAIRNHTALILRRASMQGFLVFDHPDRIPKAIEDLATWAAEGRIQNRVDVVEGLENAPEALARLFTGENVGKQLVRIA